jgi:HD-GYP domain-containing protein (c-di-GMP phosphodiesterase class II)
MRGAPKQQGPENLWLSSRGELSNVDLSHPRRTIRLSDKQGFIMSSESTQLPFNDEGQEAKEHEANPQALNAIFQACLQFPMTASEDIVDVRGMNLWAKGRQISSDLQQRLLERKLVKPLETCLTVEGGVTLFSLHHDLQTYLLSDDSLAKGLSPNAPFLLGQVKQLSLHPVAQLLLTTAMATRPAFLHRAVMCMAMAGAIMSQRKGSPGDIRLAMLAGLLHDIGEIYVEPVLIERSGPLDLSDHKQVVVHPRVAQLLLSTTTDYPEAVTRAIAEHHERLDGSGYPARLKGTQISPLGQLLAVVDTTVDLTSSLTGPLTRAAFALRAVPGEFNAEYAGFVFHLAQEANEVLPDRSQLPFTAPNGPMMIIIGRLAQTTELLNSVKRQGRTTGAINIVSTALDRLSRLRVAWNALGYWGLDTQKATTQEMVEIALLGHELNLRLHAMQRESLLLAEHLPPSDRNAIALLWADLV